MCTLFRQCGPGLGFEVVVSMVWLMRQCQGSEPERHRRVISLTTGRTTEPLNPGPHSVHSTSLWDASRGALTAPMFSLDPRHNQSRAVHNGSPSPTSITTISTVHRGCLCVPASSGVYGPLNHSCRVHSQDLAANKHSGFNKSTR